MSANLSMIDPHVLQTFLAIADAGSFAAAARQIGRTEPAVSMQMKRLEELVGDPPLFARVGRKTQLTERAEGLIPHVRRVLEAHADLSNAVLGQKPATALRLGVPDDYLESLMSGALQRFARRCPHIRVELACHCSETLANLVSERRLDLAVITKGDMPSEVEVVRHEPMVWAAAPDYRLEPEAGVPIATFQSGCWGREMALRACGESGIRHHVAYSSPSLAGILWAVRKGLAVAPLAHCSVPDDLNVLEEDGLEPVLPPLPSLSIALLRSTAPLADKKARIVLEEEIRMAMRSSAYRREAPDIRSLI